MGTVLQMGYRTPHNKWNGVAVSEAKRSRSQVWWILMSCLNCLKNINQTRQIFGQNKNVSSSPGRVDWANEFVERAAITRRFYENLQFRRLLTFSQSLTIMLRDPFSGNRHSGAGKCKMQEDHVWKHEFWIFNSVNSECSRWKWLSWNLVASWLQLAFLQMSGQTLRE